MSTQDIVQKLWNLCNVLRDDGITYHQYVTELTYILFLKMAKETGAESEIPEKDVPGFVYCRSGRRSKIAAEALISLGYSEVYEFGGIIDWPYEIEQ